MLAFLNTWQLNVILFLVFIVLFFQFYKLAVQYAKRDGAATILLQFIAGMSILVLAPLFPFTIPTNPKVLLLLLIACIFYTLNDRLQTTARKNLPVSTFSILNQLTNVILIVIGILVFREPVLMSKIMGAGLILLGNAIIFYQKGSFAINKYVVISVLASIAFATAISIDIGISKQFNLPFYIMLTLIIPALMLVFGEKISIKNILEEYQTKTRRYYWITGLAWSLAIFFSLRAYQLGPVTTIVPLQATAVVLNVLVAYFLLHERTDKFKKLVAAAIVVAGIYLTVI